jgi:S1-C subfamily serine protease
MVVLVGSGHVAYGMGIERQAAQWFDGKMASLIPIEVADGKGRPIQAVRASYADFIWGLPPEKDALYPELGLASGEVTGATRRKVLSVSGDSPAQRAGFKIGDILQQ